MKYACMILIYIRLKSSWFLSSALLLVNPLNLLTYESYDINRHNYLGTTNTRKQSVTWPSVSVRLLISPTTWLDPLMANGGWR